MSHDVGSDIPQLVNFYVGLYNTEFRKRIKHVTPAAMARLKTYGWPGNVRELRNAVERAMLLPEGDELSIEHFPIGGCRPHRSTPSPCRLRDGPRAVGAIVHCPGARTQRVEPDKSCGAPGPEPRSNPLSDREIQVRKAGVDSSLRHRLSSGFLAPVKLAESHRGPMA